MYRKTSKAIAVLGMQPSSHKRSFSERQSRADPINYKAKTAYEFFIDK